MWYLKYIIYIIYTGMYYNTIYVYYYVCLLSHYAVLKITDNQNYYYRFQDIVVFEFGTQAAKNA